MSAFAHAWVLLKQEGYRQAGGTLIRDSEGRVLLVRRNELLPDGSLKPGGSNHGMYELPGGNIDPGETAQEGVARETLEETGLPLVNMTALEPNVYDKKQKVYHGFTADIDPSHQGELQLSDEHDEYKWMHPHEALAMNEHPDGMDIPYWLSQDAETFFRQMVSSGDMKGDPLSKAWRVLKFGYPAGYDMPDEVRARHNLQPAESVQQNQIDYSQDWHYDKDMYMQLIQEFMRDGMSLPAALNQIGQDYDLTPTELQQIRSTHESENMQPLGE